MFTTKSISRLFSVLFVVVFMLALVGPTHAAPATFAEPAKEGEVPSLLQFTSSGHALGFAADGMYAATGSHALHVDFVGANRVQPRSDTPTSEQGQTASLSRMTYADLWDGITLAYTPAAGGIYTTTYTLTPGANPAEIRLHYNAPLTLNADGTLSIAFKTGTMTESAPLAWQEVDGKRVNVEAAFRLRGQEVAFALGAYDPQYPLVIDPTIFWNTFLGGSGEDLGNSIAVDSSGNVYVAGTSEATWGSSPKRLYTASFDAFAAKLDSSGILLWNTFLGGSGYDVGNAISVDSSGKIYVAGYSDVSWGSPRRAHASGSDAFAAKLNSSGGLLWNTFLGGSGADLGNSIAVDSSGNVYVAGWSYASWGSPVRDYAQYKDAFAAKLNSSGGLTWNTFLGGSGIDEGISIAVDGSENVYVAGMSGQTWGSPVRNYTSDLDAFIAKLDSSGSLTWNTFLGGNGGDFGSCIAVDGSGNLYVAGYSTASWGSNPQRAYTSSWDTFAAKLNSSGSLLWNTFLGGSGIEYSTGIAVDGSGNLYVAGTSDASWGSPVRSYTSNWDAFAVKLNSSGNLLWNTFLGGSGIDYGTDIAVDGSGNVHVAGTSDATWGSPVRAHFGSGNYDAFIAKVDVVPPLVNSSLRLEPSPTAARLVDFTVAFSEDVTGVDKTDFTLTITGSITGAAVSSVTGSGAAYTVTVKTGSGDGTLRLNVTDNDSIVDGFGNPLHGAGAGNGNFTSGEAYTVDKSLVVRSQAAYDGWVLESSETSNKGGTMNDTATAFYLGDDAQNRQYRSILSFYTAGLPGNAIITKVTLKIMKQGLTGTNPFTTHGSILLDVRKGVFSNNNALQLGDFQAVASKSAGWKITNTPVSGWYSVNFGASIFIYVNRTGITQFRLRFTKDDNNDNGADYLKFYSGNYAGITSRPQLIIEYYVP
jgi:hypothetical protein